MDYSRQTGAGRGSGGGGGGWGEWGLQRENDGGVVVFVHLFAFKLFVSLSSFLSVYLAG